ncbi:early nodulin-like protein 20 [Rutidosis leptorrhynchoides]|uniref:early nodulin-like protein 20 n=1 Tax=Rutidosis leptorrhynchoides TaxID=125765 RepID=UPI003A991F9D
MRSSRYIVRPKTATVAIAIATMLTCVMCRDPVRHLVGGKDRWQPNVNYTNWSLHETFYVGEWLYFMYDKHLFNVLQVNQTSYENCTDQGFIYNITRGAGRDVFELIRPKPYYFLSSGGYCYNGMKVAVNVVEFVAAPQPAPVPSGCTVTKINLLVSLVVISIWAVFLKN